MRTTSGPTFKALPFTPKEGEFLLTRHVNILTGLSATLIKRDAESGLLPTAYRFPGPAGMEGERAFWAPHVDAYVEFKRSQQEQRQRGRSQPQLQLDLGQGVFGMEAR